MNLPSWNLNEFYSSFKDKQINKDLHSLKKKISLFSAKYKGKLGKFSDGELSFRYTETVRGSDVYIIQSTVDSSDNIMELFL